MTAPTTIDGAEMLTDDFQSNPLFEALKLAVGMLSLHGHEDEAKKVVAEARLLSASKPAAPEGWKLVPVEPTLEMQYAGIDNGASRPSAAYAAMLAASTAAPAQSGEPVAWVRYRSDGGFEGPIMETDERMCDSRRSFWTPLYAAPQPSQTAVVLDDERAALPEEVREALTHELGGWRGAARGTRDDAKGERRSVDYNRRAQVIEDWLARAASPQVTATQPAGGES